MEYPYARPGNRMTAVATTMSLTFACRAENISPHSESYRHSAAHLPHARFRTAFSTCSCCDKLSFCAAGGPRHPLPAIRHMRFHARGEAGENCCPRPVRNTFDVTNP